MRIAHERFLTPAIESRGFFRPEPELTQQQLEAYGMLQLAETALSEAELVDLTFELLGTKDEAELDLFLGKLANSVGRAAKKVSRGVASAARGVASAASAVGKFAPVSALASLAAKTPIGMLARAGYGGLAAAAKGENIFRGAVRSLAADPIMRFALDTGMGVARGENLMRAAQQAAKAGIGDLRESVRFAAMVAPFVPGVGSGVAAALGAANALASGQPIKEAMISAMRSAIPGGAVAQTAFDVGSNLARGKSLSQAALDAARNQLPQGPARAAFDAGLAIAKGKTIQDAAFAAAGRMLPPSPYAADLSSFTRRALAGENLGKAALSTAGNAVIKRIEQQGGNILQTVKGKVPTSITSGQRTLSKASKRTSAIGWRGEIGTGVDAARIGGSWVRRGNTILLRL